MPVDVRWCSEMLDQEGVRHHVDAEENAVRIVFITRTYRNLRDENFAIVRLETPDDGTRCRVSIERAFACEDDVASVALTACRLAAATPLVNAEIDSDFDNLRLVVETVVEDGSLTRLQLMSMIDRIVEAAELWHGPMANVPNPKQTAA
jgi:hypothetical protein